MDKSFEYYFIDEDINSKFIKNTTTKNNIYFNCSKKRNGCIGLIKYDLLNKISILIYKCNNKIKHDTSKFENFYEDFLKKI